MTTDAERRLEKRVRAAAEAALREHKYVSAIDVLVGIGWLTGSEVDRWRQGRVDYLEQVAQANLSKLTKATKMFRTWARERGLKPSETAYVARTRDRRQLRFSKSGKASIEQAYRTHWVSPALSEAKRERLAERQSKPPDLLVIDPVRDWTCTECGGTGGLLIMEDPGPLCLACADLDHLAYLPAGNTALTRRAKKASTLSAVVVRFSRTRRRYERQGILVEENALETAEAQCLADAEARERRQERARVRREAADHDFQDKFASEISRLYPGCPATRAEAIARHAGLRGSGRVGRSAAGRALDAEAVTMAVVASIRHEDTEYDELLMHGTERADARERVRGDVEHLLVAWQEADSDRADRP